MVKTIFETYSFQKLFKILQNGTLVTIYPLPFFFLNSPCINAASMLIT